MVKEFVANNDVRQITRLTAVLADEFAVSHNNHSRKGGLIGLAATAIALGKVPLQIQSVNFYFVLPQLALLQEDQEVTEVNIIIISELTQQDVRGTKMANFVSQA